MLWCTGGFRPCNYQPRRPPRLFFFFLHRKGFSRENPAEYVDCIWLIKSNDMEEKCWKTLMRNKTWFALSSIFLASRWLLVLHLSPIQSEFNLEREFLCIRICWPGQSSLWRACRFAFMVRMEDYSFISWVYVLNCEDWGQIISIAGGPHFYLRGSRGGGEAELSQSRTLWRPHDAGAPTSAIAPGPRSFGVRGRAFGRGGGESKAHINIVHINHLSAALRTKWCLWGPFWLFSYPVVFITT